MILGFVLGRYGEVFGLSVTPLASPACGIGGVVAGVCALVVYATITPNVDDPGGIDQVASNTQVLWLQEHHAPAKATRCSFHVALFVRRGAYGRFVFPPCRSGATAKLPARLCRSRTPTWRRKTSPRRPAQAMR